MSLSLCPTLLPPPSSPPSLPSPSLLLPSLSPSLTQDFFATIVFGVFYVIADIAWSAGIGQLAGFVGDQLRDLAVNCLMCNNLIEVQDGTIVQTFAQPAISVVCACHLCVCICVCVCPVCLCVSMYVCVCVCLPLYDIVCYVGV